ncbi:WGR domain-containing protein [Rhizobium laguerreae]|uniref:WGR domain-containing protein n=1 Tax=Rhizobium laguerreae TaxID=1076926 RepID=UPI0035E3FC0B
MRRWGRIGKCGGERTDVFGTEQEAVAHFLDLARRKRRKGYRPTKAAMPLVTRHDHSAGGARCRARDLFTFEAGATKLLPRWVQRS